MGNKQLNIQVKLSTTDTYRIFCKYALVNSESSSSYISQKFVKKNNINIYKLLFPIICYNIDSLANRDRSIIEVIKINMTISDHQKLI